MNLQQEKEIYVVSLAILCVMWVIIIIDGLFLLLKRDDEAYTEIIGCIILFIAIAIVLATLFYCLVINSEAAHEGFSAPFNSEEYDAILVLFIISLFLYGKYLYRGDDNDALLLNIATVLLFVASMIAVICIATA